MGMMTSFTTPEGVRYMAWSGFAGAGYKINPDGSYNPKAKEIAEAFNKARVSRVFVGDPADNQQV